MKTRGIFLWQAFLVTFLWSISKIIIKFGLVLVSPYALTFAVQFVALVALALYYFIKKPKLVWQNTIQWTTLIVLMGITGYVVAPLFAIIGLKFASGTIASLFAGLNSTFVMVLAWAVLREKPTALQLLGLAIAFAGAVVFLGGESASGAILGILLILLAELSYALNTVLARFLSRSPDEEAFTLTLFGAAIGTILLTPVGILSGDLPKLIIGVSPWIVLIIGVIFAYAGLMWNGVLDKIRALEAAIMQNTMIVQIAILSVIFLHEKITFHNILGGIMVLVGAYLVEAKILERAKT